MGAQPPRQAVVLIHGIMADRSWYAKASSALANDYQCMLVKYHGYDTVLTPLQLAGGRVLLGFALLAAAAWVACALVGRTGSWLFWAALVALALWVPVAWLGDRRRAAARRAVIHQLDRAYRHNHFAPLHVIAHSFGTVLLGEALGFLPVPLCHRVVLAGSALPRAFPWHDLLYRVSPLMPSSRSHVRNEMGAKDLVIRIAGVSGGRLVPGIGDAGLRGFFPAPAGAATVVHDVGTTLGPCGSCAGGAIREGTIHNVPLMEYAHSDFFRTDVHARLLWRPVLWGMEPWDWCDLLIRCDRIVDLLDQGLQPDAAREIDILCSQRYRWTATAPSPGDVRAYVRERVDRRSLQTRSRHRREGRCPARSRESEPVRLGGRHCGRHEAGPRLSASCHRRRGAGRGGMTASESRDEPLALLLGRLAERRDDEDAWGSLYRLLWPFVYASAFRQLRGRWDLAEDAAQEVFLRLARYAPLEDLREPGAFRAYVWVTAKNITRTMLKRQIGAKELPLGDRNDPMEEVLTASGGDPSRRAEIRDTVRALLDRLPGPDAEIVRLLLQGADLKEIAAETGRGYSDVAVRLHRLRARLKARGIPGGP